MADGACVVCGTDLSDGARPAVEAAAALAGRVGGMLWVAHAVELPPGTRSEDVTAEAEARLAAWRGDVGARHGIAEVRDAVLVGEAAGALAAFAAAKRACAVVVASQGHGAGALFRLGGTSERLAVESQLPVLVVRDAGPFTRWARGEAPLRVLLAVDFTQRSDAAIRFVRLLRAAGPADVTVTHVHYPGLGARYGVEPDAPSAERDAALDALLRRDLARLVGALGGEGAEAYRPFAGMGRIGDHVLEVAREVGADVVVVGTRGTRGLRRLASVSSVVLHHGGMAVVCAPRVRDEVPEPLPPFRRVLFPTDLSEASSRAVASAYRLLPEGGEVCLLHVAPSSARAGEPDGELELVRRLRALVPPWATGRGILSRTEVVYRDDVVAAICETAARRGADVVCVGSRGRSALLHAVLGSVAEGVARASDRPVLVIPPLPG